MTQIHNADCVVAVGGSFQIADEEKDDELKW